MDDGTHNQLAEKILTTLPKYMRWLTSFQYFMTPYGRLGIRPLGILWIIRREQIQADDVSPSSLAQHMKVRPSVITRALTRLEEDGLIERAIDLQDRRRVTITLTEKGQEVSIYVEKMYLGELAGGMHALDVGQVNELLRAMDYLDTVLSSLEPHEPGTSASLTDGE